jgi:predicted transcriptional regulator
VTPEFLISLEDGRQYRNLSLLGLTPQAYRDKWGLPQDYPMVAPNYDRMRSELARSSDLGKGRKSTVPKAAAASKDETVAAPAEAPKPKRRAPSRKEAGE